MATLRRYFVTGLAVLAPILGSLWVLVTLFRFADGLIGQFLPPRMQIPGLGLLLTVLVVLGTGVLATNIMGRKLIQLAEWIFSRLPFVRGIYNTFRQLVDVVSPPEGAGSFQRVVLVEFPRPGLWSLGLVTGEGGGEMQRQLDTELLHVFVPTTPNPTSGYLLMVPRRDVVPLAMPVQEAMQIIVSGGVFSPPDKDVQPGAQPGAAPRAGGAGEPAGQLDGMEGERR